MNKICDIWKRSLFLKRFQNRIIEKLNKKFRNKTTFHKKRLRTQKQFCFYRLMASNGFRVFCFIY